MLFKVDFEKTFDSVDSNYLDFVMKKMGFCVKWRNWMSECLRLTFMLVLVNGSPTKEFGVGRGLRQGDLLSSFLFLLAAEGFNVMMSKSVHLDLFEGYQLDVTESKCFISNMQTTL